MLDGGDRALGPLGMATRLPQFPLHWPSTSKPGAPTPAGSRATLELTSASGRTAQKQQLDFNNGPGPMDTRWEQFSSSVPA